LPILSVQYHPEAHPGPHDNMYLFSEFVARIRGTG
jgi:carbamoyl-phosphate synthase small subunit